MTRDRLDRLDRRSADMPRALRARFGALDSDRVASLLSDALLCPVEISVGRPERIRGSLSARVRSSAGALVVLGPTSGALRGRLVVDLDATLAAALGTLGTLGTLGRALDRAADAVGAFRCLGLVEPADELAALEVQGELSLIPLSIRIGPTRGTARIHLPDAAVEAFEPSTVPRREMSAALRSAPTRIALVRALARVTAEELRSLRPGDVLLPDAIFPAEAPLGRLSRGAWIDLALETRDGALRLRALEPRFALAGRHSEDIPMNPTVERLAPLEGAEVELSVEVGRVVLPLGELLALQPGDVLASLGPATSRVQIRAGEALVARGELVELAGELGVRITEVDGPQSTIG